ncbi:c-type cytochrome [Helicobacter sp. MIT 99-5507]|uniref:c-type cytochrome n=1 Tax=Helicobacter sp. MIT 99-5507 TaxID=152489 RepID=UPI000E1E5F46|nr:c-type cytochrome [Helicobacter sp. MIT 99-5507]RDU56517.1 cytochrome C [Helicobacter sp. MIT 99-5507]
MSALRELKIFAFVAIVVGILYWGVEPLAHSVFHPKTAPADFKFSDLEDLPTTGNVENGKVLATTYCVACHSIQKDGYPALLTNDLAASAYGVVPPDLSNIGAIYDGKFLANLIKDPVKALKLTHKFNDTKPFPMTPTLVSDAELGDMVAYFKSLAANVQLSNKEIFEESCVRCHSVKYDKVVALTPSDTIVNYMGAKAPDLSMMIRSRGEETLNKFINDPQKTLVGTSMPRVGLTQDSQEKVIAYLEKIGDSKKDQREFVGKILIGFMIIMAILAYLWKRKIWHDLH